MRFLCDENLPPILISFLKNLPGSFVKSIAGENLFGLSDEAIATRSVLEKSVIVTFDKDFLAIKQQGLRIIYLKFPRTAPIEVVSYLEAAVKLASKFQKRKAGFVLHVTKQTITAE